VRRLAKTRQARQVISLSEARYQRAYRRLLADLLAYGRDCLDEESWALDQFYGPAPTDSEMDVLQEAFLDWVLFNYRDWDGRTLLERFAAEGGAEAAEETERELLQAWRSSRPGLYRVCGQTGESVTLADLFTPARYEVQLEPDMAPFAAEDLVVCRVLPSGDSYRFGMDVRTGPADAEAAIRPALEAELERLRRQQPGAGWNELFAERWPLVNDAMTQAIALDGAMPAPAEPGPASLGLTEPPAGASPLHCQVADRLTAFLEDDGARVSDLQRALRLWWDAAAALAPRSGKPETWAAGVVYATFHFGLGDETTQAEVADAFGLSVSTVATRSRAIASSLSLAELDERYADPFDARFRYRPWVETRVRRLLGEPAAGLEPESVHDRVVLLAAQENDAGLLAAVCGENPGNLDAFTLLRAGIAAARRGSLGQADHWMALAEEHRELPHLTVPYRAALTLMQAGRIPSIMFDYAEAIELPDPESPTITSLMRALLVHAIFCRSEEQAADAAGVIATMPNDPWLDELLARVAQDPALPESVHTAATDSLAERHRAQ
jgi:hypothetical protein